MLYNPVIGFWLDNKKDGDGIFKYENNDEFSGSWKSDMKHGVGTYTFCKTGVVLKGKWSDDKKVENFELYFPTSKGEGFTFHGTWDDEESVSNLRLHFCRAIKIKISINNEVQNVEGF